METACSVCEADLLVSFIFHYAKFFGFFQMQLELYKNTTTRIIHLYFSVVCQRGKDLEMWFKPFCLNRTIHKYNPEVLCNSVTTEIKIKVWNSAWKHSFFWIQKGCWFHILYHSDHQLCCCLSICYILGWAAEERAAGRSQLLGRKN